jgi:hypothetical protein
MIKKLSLNNSRAYTLKLIELVKAGFEIDMTQTGTFYGRVYTIAYEDGVKQDVPADSVVDKGVGKSLTDTDVPEQTEEQVPQTEDTEKAPVARGRKPSGK